VRLRREHACSSLIALGCTGIREGAAPKLVRLPRL
jgi:hypothetical protein